MNEIANFRSHKPCGRIMTMPNNRNELRYRRKILLRLYHLYSKKGPNSALYTEDLPGYSRSAEKVSVALNQLLSEKLVLGRRADDKPPEKQTGQSNCFYVNEEKLEKIRKELHVWYRDPRFLIPVAIGLAGVVWAVASVFL